MVQMALDKLNENDIVELDEERKAAMVSNLLVVLCGNKDAQPIVTTAVPSTKIRKRWDTFWKRILRKREKPKSRSL